MHVASLTPDPVLMRRFSRLAQVPHLSHATEHWQMALVSSFNLSEWGHKSYRQFHRNESLESKRDFPFTSVIALYKKIAFISLETIVSDYGGWGGLWRGLFLEKEKWWAFAHWNGKHTKGLCKLFLCFARWKRRLMQIISHCSPSR